MAFFTGFVPNATALIASQVPKDKSGYALGTLSTGVVAGTLTGPFVGGLIAEFFWNSECVFIGWQFLVFSCYSNHSFY